MSSPEHEDRARVTNWIEAHGDDASVARVAGETGADPAVVADVLDKTIEEPDVSPSDPQGDDGESGEDRPAETWSDVDFTNPLEDPTRPDELLERVRWMGAGGASGKQPFARWGARNPDTDCNTRSCPADRADDPECDCDGRYKWGASEHYRAGDDVPAEPMTFIFGDDLPYVFVDGDDVRDDAGELHPRFRAILSELGVSWTEVSTSGAGVHVVFRGELPAGLSEAKWTIDDEAWTGDELPAVELYSNRHVMLSTGRTVAGSPLTVGHVDADGLESVLDDAGELPDRPSAEDDNQLEGYEPTATTADETTTDVRDVMRALDSLNARRVADKTIASGWVDDRHIRPIWASASYQGTAVFVDRDKFVDVGQNGGRGGPAVMAAISELGVSNKQTPEAVRGETWVRAVDELREMGFDVPQLVRDPLEVALEHEPDSDDDQLPLWCVVNVGQHTELASDDEIVTRSGDDGEYESLTPEAYQRVIQHLESEGITTGRVDHLEMTNAYLEAGVGVDTDDPSAALARCLRARDDGRVSELSDAPNVALAPIVEGVFGVDMSDASEGTISAAQDIYRALDGLADARDDPDIDVGGPEEVDR